MPEQTQRQRPPAEKQAQEETPAKDQRPSPEKQAEWDKVLEDVDEMLAEMEATETAEQFVREYRQKGGQRVTVSGSSCRSVHR